MQILLQNLQAANFSVEPAILTNKINLICTHEMQIATITLIAHWFLLNSLRLHNWLLESWSKKWILLKTGELAIFEIKIGCHTSKTMIYIAGKIVLPSVEIAYSRV